MTRSVRERLLDMVEQIERVRHHVRQRSDLDDDVKQAATSKLADRLRRSAFPKAQVVVLEGGALAAGQPDPQIRDAEVHALLGQLAYRLGGAPAFAKVAV